MHGVRGGGAGSGVAGRRMPCNRWAGRTAQRGGWEAQSLRQALGLFSLAVNGDEGARVLAVIV